MRQRQKPVAASSGKVVKGILRNNTSYQRPLEERSSALMSELKQDFKKEVRELFSLSSNLKKELQNLKAFRTLPMNRQVTRQSDLLLEDSNYEGSRLSEEDLNQEIKKKVQYILDGQLEWEKQRKVFNEKLEKIEKNIERTMDDTASNLVVNTQTAKTMNKDPIIKRPPKDKDMKDSGRTSFSIAVPDQKLTVGSLRKVPDVQSRGSRKSLVRIGSALSLGTQPSKVYQQNNKSYEQVVKLCLDQFSKPTNASSLVDIQCIRQKIDIDGKMYDVLYDMINGTSRNLTDSVLSIEIYAEDAKFCGQPIVAEKLNGENLAYVLKNIQALEVVPSGLPITALIHTGYLINFILHKFVRVNSFKKGRRFSPRWLEDRNRS
jgi:hypothetical protein